MHQHDGTGPTQISSPDPRLQPLSWVPLVAGILLGIGITSVVMPSLLYALAFGPAVSSQQEDWARFGDFLGGVAGTTVALLAFIALALSVFLQYRLLRATQDELALSRAEMAAQRDELALQRTEAEFDRLVDGLERIYRTMQYRLLAPLGGRSQVVIGYEAFDQLAKSIDALPVEVAARAREHDADPDWMAARFREVEKSWVSLPLERLIAAWISILTFAQERYLFRGSSWNFFLSTRSTGEIQLLLLAGSLWWLRLDLRQLLVSAEIADDFGWARFPPDLGHALEQLFRERLRHDAQVGPRLEVVVPRTEA